MKNSKQKSVTKKGLVGLVWNFSGSAIQIFAQIIVISILSRILTPEEFGIVAVILIFVSFSELFTQMGISSALIQLPKLTRNHISLGYTLSVIIGIVVGVIFYFIAP